MNYNQQEKKQIVKNVFDSVAFKYDIMNDLMSFGIHRLWKKEMLLELTSPNSRLLDVASGTGDIALSFYKKSDGKAKITMLDINPNMLEYGRNKLIDNGIFNEIELVCANAEHLPFDDNSFDYYTIAFGIRNVPDLQKAIDEAYRVLKPGGKFICLEFSHVKNEALAKFYEFYSDNFIPQIGEMVTGSKMSYEYLVDSIRKFPSQEKFKEMIVDAGFERAKFRNLTFGVCAIHTGWKI